MFPLLSGGLAALWALASCNSRPIYITPTVAPTETPTLEAPITCMMPPEVSFEWNGEVVPIPMVNTEWHRYFPEGETITHLASGVNLGYMISENTVQMIVNGRPDRSAEMDDRDVITHVLAVGDTPAIAMAFFKCGDTIYVNYMINTTLPDPSAPSSLIT